jgi:hypothetical protein
LPSMHEALDLIPSREREREREKERERGSAVSSVGDS